MAPTETALPAFSLWGRRRGTHLCLHPLFLPLDPEAHSATHHHQISWPGYDPGCSIRTFLLLAFEAPFLSAFSRYLLPVMSSGTLLLTSTHLGGREKGQGKTPCRSPTWPHSVPTKGRINTREKVRGDGEGLPGAETKETFTVVLGAVLRLTTW